MNDVLNLDVFSKGDGFFQEVLQAAGVGFWSYDHVSDSITWSSQMLAMLGRDQGDSPKKLSEWFALIHPEDQPRIQACMEAAVNACSPLYELQFRYLHRQGHWLWVECRGRIIQRASDGRPLLMAGVTSDISQLKHTESTLEGTEARFRELIEQIPVGVYTLSHQKSDDSVRFIYVSHRFCQMIGIEKDAILSDPSLPFDAATAEDRSNLIRMNQEALETGKPFEFEGRFEVGGHIRWLRINSHPKRHPGGETLWDGVVIDITDSKAVERDLQLRTHFLEVAQKAARIGYFVTDMRTGRWEGSTMFYDVMGIDESYDRSIVGWSQLVHPDDRARSLDEFRQAMQQSGHLHHHYRIVRPCDGEILWVDAWANLEYEDGQASKLIGTVKDITERKVNEIELDQYRSHLEALVEERTKALQESERIARQERQQLADIIWGTHVGTWEWNIATGTVRLNERWAELVGYSLEELEPTSIDTWVRLAHPDDLKASEALLACVFRREMPFYEAEVRMRHKGGHWVWVLDRGRVLAWDPEGNPLRMSGTHMDITTRKEAEMARLLSETRFRDISTLTSDWIWEVDAAARYSYVSGRVHEVLGYAENDLIGRSPFEFMTPEEAQRVAIEFGSYVESRSPFRDLENTMLDRDGTPRVLLTSAIPLIDEQGQFQGYRGMDRDITESRRANEALRRSEQRFQQMAETVPIILYDYVYYPDGTDQFLYVGPISRDILEIDAKALQADSGLFWKIIHPDDLGAFREANRIASIEKTNFLFETRIVTKSGCPKWIQIISRPGPTTEAGAVVWSGFVLDITERKAAESEIESYHQLLEDEVRHDPLTGLFNRRAWNERLEEEWRRAGRAGKPLSLLVIDIDRFKAFNDQYGHLQGDQCLRRVAETVEKSVTRASDFVARFGGEEFVALLGETPLNGAVRVAERIRAAVHSLAIPHQASIANQLLSVSIGVAATVPSPRTEHDSLHNSPNCPIMTAETLLEMADKALYTAKSEGRNRVCAYKAS